MSLANYINDLLYRYDCVIVPNFGGFVTNKISAVVNNHTHTFHPPTKQLSFNIHLKHNDGLLANYIASVENISFERANDVIVSSVLKWQTELQSKSIEIASVGRLSLNDEKQLIFEPNTTTNFLSESFGFSTVKSPVIERFKQEVKPLIPVQETSNEEAKKGIPAFVKYAATAAILLTVGTFSFNQYNQIQQQKEFAKQQEQVEQKIQSATFVIDNPLPTINLNFDKVNPKEFHVIAGAFQLTENATKKVNQLKEKGYNARILGLNEWGLIQVSFESFEKRQEAKTALRTIKNSGSEDAWLLIKKFD
ncbi:sporulation related protein [Tenacibaculum adriaticum]|uniref:Sporulation related protein n=1 Tax=Tenacibaculum adriaticum TaxID=413713 RepID=A0A5S5DVJ3_9FLAO|nr:SPOR domain-containing protein [Tenacibaculum adriaticum]TYP99871.1 sporulation related protein [Tenacibaculum adriaticum]